MIGPFEDNYHILSNAHLAPQGILLDGISYPTVIHAWYAAKNEDISYRQSLLSMSPTQARRAGEKAIARDGWDDMKYGVLVDLTRQKFVKYDEFRYLLLSTGDEELVDINYRHDNYFGQCECDECLEINHNNYLGVVLMQIRAEINEG